MRVPRPARQTRTGRPRAADVLSRRQLRVSCAVVLILVGVITSTWLPTQASPAAAAAPTWMDTAQSPAQRTAALMAVMNLDDKLAMLHNTTNCQYAGCTPSSFTGGVLPPLHLQDGPLGVGDGVTGVTQLPAPVAGAASWDTALMRQYGSVLGQEHWGKGVNVVLGPTVNIVRDPRWGRAFESFGEDPHLAGQIGAADIIGIQAQGPLAQIKHYAAYNQETFRNSTADNVIVDERTLREIYLPQFEAAIKQANVASAMCAYSVINGAFACENGHLQNEILKGDLGFAGFITADWGATHSTVASANNGLDMEMPDSNGFYGSALKTAVTNGQVSMATIDDHVRRILVQMFRFGLFDKVQPGTKDSAVTSSAHTTVARQVAEQGSVLLKNAGPILPLGATARTIAVIGADAGANTMTQGGGSAGVNATAVVTPYNGIKNRAGGTATVNYFQGNAGSSGALPPVPSSVLTPSQGSGSGLFGQFFSNTSLGGAAVATRVDPTVDFNWAGTSPAPGIAGTNWSAKWTGSLRAPTTGNYTFSLTSDDGSRLFVNGQSVISNWADQGSTTKTGTVSLTAGQAATIEVQYYQGGGLNNLTLGWQQPGQSLQDQAATGARNADVAVVFVNKFQSEGSDTGDIDLGAEQNNLVSAVAAANPNTVVVLHTGSAVTMPWINSVKGVIEAWYPGQESGDAIASLLFGDVNPSGKLPVTFPASLSDVPANTTARWPGQNGQVQYSEGLGVGYRWYDKQNITPLFPFGFGLSYTSFSYSALTVGGPDANGNVPVGFTVTNTGSRAGSDVAQVYVGQPVGSGEPPKSLQGFNKVTLAPGAATTVNVSLPARAFQFWGGSGWTNATGANAVYVGASSRDLRLTGSVTIGGVSATRSAYSTIQAESYDAQTGTQTEATADTGGGQDVAFIGNGDFLRYDGVQFAAAAGTGVTARIASGAAGNPAGSMEVRLDSLTNPPVATVAVAGTGGWQTWTSPSAALAATTGTHTVFLKFVSPAAGDFVNLNWFTFTQGAGATETPLSRVGWTASASSTAGGDVPANALDGNPGSRWSTGIPMAPGQHFTVDMAAVRAFDQVTIDAAGSANDYPRAVSIQVSPDGTTWNTVTTATGTAAKLTVSFAAQSSRYLRVLQTGSASSWWSIAELNVLTGSAVTYPTALSRTGWIATANASGGGAAANAIDADLSTRFSTGTPMASGQYFQVDMASVRTFDQVTMDSGGSANDYARGYTVQVSNDATSWTPAISGVGTGAVVTARFPNQSARYLRIVQTGSSPSWWSITDFNVYAG